MYPRLPLDMKYHVQIWQCLYDYIALSRTCREAWHLSLQKAVGVHVTYSDTMRARRGRTRVPVWWWRELAARYRIVSVWCTYWEWLRCTSSSSSPSVVDIENKSHVEEDSTEDVSIQCGGKAYQWMVRTNPRLTHLNVTLNAISVAHSTDNVSDLPLFPSTLRRLHLSLKSGGWEPHSVGGGWRWESLSRLACLIHLDASITDLSDCRHLPPTLTSCRIRTIENYPTKEVVEAWKHLTKLPLLRRVSTAWCGSTLQVMNVFRTAAPLAWEKLEIHMDRHDGEVVEVKEMYDECVFPRLQRLRLRNAQHYTPNDWRRWKCFAPSLLSLDVDFSVPYYRKSWQRAWLLGRCLPIGEWSSLRRLVLRGNTDSLLDAPPSALPWQGLTSLQLRWHDHPSLRLPLHLPFLTGVTQLTITPLRGHTDMFRLAARHLTHLTHLTVFLRERESFGEMSAFTRLVYLDLTLHWECTDMDMEYFSRSLPATTLQRLRMRGNWRSVRDDTWIALAQRLVSLMDWSISYPSYQSPPTHRVAPALERGCRVHWFSGIAIVPLEEE